MSKNNQQADGHWYCLFATTIANVEDQPRLMEFFDAAKARDWKRLHSFTEWNAMEVDLEAFIIRCSKTIGLLVVVRNPSELYEPEQVCYLEQLGHADLQVIETLAAKTDWKPI